MRVAHAGAEAAISGIDMFLCGCASWTVYTFLGVVLENVAASKFQLHYPRIVILACRRAATQKNLRLSFQIAHPGTVVLSVRRTPAIFHLPLPLQVFWPG